ncbi:Spy/CpxP family protein refolding chaperone [Hydrogenophaga sp.]|uniref:Spy/CpxP family protein refolding chaperone n=1 Tax=Hydrogenophaga sp. TaxID=1904254 RepID=UPI0025BCB227|nr:Spy/CpxP family protein refolding chaperone [Hydrogenophaga sp.]
MNRSLVFMRGAVLALGLLTLGSVAMAKSVPADQGLPVVELMPLVIKHEADLRLSAEQIAALADYRKQAMPGRISVQKKIQMLRGELRMAILDNKPAADREALMKQIGDAEIEHFKGRDRCVEALRKILSAEQFAQLSKLYLDGLR